MTNKRVYVLEFKFLKEYFFKKMSPVSLHWQWHRMLIDKYKVLRPFSKKDKKKVLLIVDRPKIAKEQVFPFFYYRNALDQALDAEVREIPLSSFRKDRSTYSAADIVCFQTSFDLSEEEMSELVSSIKGRYPKAKICYLDWFAPTDLRFANVLNSHIDLYIKKHLLKNRSEYQRPTIGDTNLTDYYCRRYHISERQKLFPVPQDFLEKIVVGWNFAFTDYLIPYFVDDLSDEDDRDNDLHCRITSHSEVEWYSKMREESYREALGYPAESIVSKNYVKRAQFFNELRTSKFCFSPFGFGEVCYRDYEAAALGAALVKQDMSHIETAPDIFHADSTYQPVSWDLHDFEEKCLALSKDRNKRRAMASKAHAIVKQYIQEDHALEVIKKIIA